MTKSGSQKTVGLAIRLLDGTIPLTWQMRTVTSGLVTLEIRHLKCHPPILILKYENNVLSSTHSSLTSRLGFERRSLAEYN